jgi:demethylmenaquinone methyltransferase/2-methoxy-6-polyprenyl-1,4-benzoquinol methylase
MGTDILWRRKFVRGVKARDPKTLLDVATGSGDVAKEVLRQCPDTAVIGADFCQPMLDEAVIKQENATESSYSHITFKQGDGLSLLLKDASFDAITISFGLRNMADRHLSLTEMRRVLRPGGRMYVLEFSQPDRWFKPIYLFYLRTVLPVIAGIVTKDKAAYVYLNETIEQFPGREGLTQEIKAAGFSSVKASGLTFGIVALHEAQV